MRTVDAHRIENLLKMCGTYHGVIAYDTVISVLHDVPTVEPERKKGKWTEDESCEFCGFQPWYENDIHTLSYCPNCGADMRGE